MAGKRSPWGEGPKGNNETNGGDTPQGDDDSSPEDKPKGPRNPWGAAGENGDKPRRSANIEDIFKTRGPEGPRRRSGGGGGPGGPNFQMPDLPIGKNWFKLAIGAVAVLWLGSGMVHQVGPREEGVVTTFGAYSRTFQPGISFTLPWPVEAVDIMDVSSIRRENIPENGSEKLMLTGDKNLVNLSYIIRWNISDLKQFKFQLAEPQETVLEVAEASMRASVSEETLDRVLSGSGRADIEQRVRGRMQAILDAYRSGVTVQGIEIEKTDPPERVIDAFKGVSAAQQEAETEVNRARAWAQQLLARAEGDAAAFDKVYAEYRLAPDVTRRRMYYETMERVLAKTDKVIVETEGVATYLPLPELKRRTQQAGEGQ